MAKKFYAIKEGFDFNNNIKIENQIVDTWAKCTAYVKGIKGAKYKSFEKIEDAQKYLSDDKKLLNKSEDSYPKDCLHIYVDGSYNGEKEKYSYGVVAVYKDVIEYIESGIGHIGEGRNIRQIAGELKGAIKAVEYAVNKGHKEIVLFHDYEGIYHHATGSWERREASSQEYYEKMQNLMDNGIKVIFVKVDSHTGDLFNELVDEKCKEVLEIPSDKVVEKWLMNNEIQVKDEVIKKEILTIAPKGEKNIKVVCNNIKHKENVNEDLIQNIIKNYKEDKQGTLKNIENFTEKEKNKIIKSLLELLQD